MNWIFVIPALCVLSFFAGGYTAESFWKRRVGRMADYFENHYRDRRELERVIDQLTSDIRQLESRKAGAPAKAD